MWSWLTTPPHTPHTHARQSFAPPPRKIDGPALMIHQKVFKIGGVGTVAIEQVVRGALKPDDILMTVPGMMKVRAVVPTGGDFARRWAMCARVCVSHDDFSCDWYRGGHTRDCHQPPLFFVFLSLL